MRFRSGWESGLSNKSDNLLADIGSLRRDRWLITRLYAGLGNRVRVLLSGSLVADAIGRKFAYAWECDWRFGARAEDLWAFPGVQLPDLLTRPWLGRFAAASGVADPGEHRARIMQVRTCLELKLGTESVDWRRRFRELVVRDDLRAEIRTEWERRLAGRPYIGVMVRAHRKSHPRTKETSPPAYFIRRMKELRQVLPGCAFYLSCDDREAERLIARSVPDVISIEKRGALNSARGVHEAVIDLYLLASASGLVGSYHSSFTDLAEALGGDSFPVETPQSAKLRLDRLVGTALNPLEPRRRFPSYDSAFTAGDRPR